MNILLINYEFPPLGAGASTATWHLGKELATMDHQILVLTSGYKEKNGYEFKEGMTIFRCPAIRNKVSESNMLEMASFVISAFFFMPKLILKHRVEMAIVFFSFPCGPLGLWANLLFKTPYIISLRGGDVPGTEAGLDRIHRILKPLRRLVFKKSKAVIANSIGLKILAQKADPIAIDVISNGIDTEYFSPPNLMRKNQCFELLFVGRLSEQKNLAFLLDQVSVLIKKQKRELRLHIAGDGPLKKGLQSHASNLGISDFIQWHGWLDKKQLLSLCRRTDCFVNPSLYEGMPNAVLEAMACGLPVIASNVAGNDAVVVDGQNGFLFSLGDHGKFRACIEKLLVNFELRQKMGKKARGWVEKNFSWNRTAISYSTQCIGDRVKQGK